MLTQDRWLLPEGIEEVFPCEAESLDRLGRRLVDRFSTWGYRLVMPPVVDFLDSLLVGTGHELDLQTLKLSDPVSGRLLGLRADMTPQVARIDARTAHDGLPTRLCYVGTVVHALSGHLEKSRNPIQVGAELYGNGGMAATGEVIRLMLETLALADVQNVHLDLGHVGIYRSLACQAGLTGPQESELFEILQRKDTTDLASFLRETQVSAPVSQMLEALLDLNGHSGVIAQARRQLSDGSPEIIRALDELAALTESLSRRYPELTLNVDLAELRGYLYHTGIVFAAFVPSLGREIARGGRYDDIGHVFGHARPAVGFSSDLKVLAALANGVRRQEPSARIFAPGVDDPELDRIIEELRREGEVVIQALGDETEIPEAMGCTRVLMPSGEGWRLV